MILSGAALPPWLQRAAGAVAGGSGVSRGARPPYALGETRLAFDALPLAPWRGLGAAPNVFAMESALDACAEAAGADPLAFRLAHLPEGDRLAGWGRALPRGRALGVAAAPYTDASWAAVIAEVEAVGGGFAVRGLWCAQDSARVLDEDRVRAQIEGNLVWAIGMALFERLSFAGGAVAETGFGDYALPRFSDIPERLGLVLAPPPPGAGFGGAGETALGPVVAAIANAALRAAGRRLKRLPLAA